jgi:hypothetical protein
VLFRSKLIPAKFLLSSEGFTRLNLDSNCLVMVFNKNTNEVLLRTVPDATSEKEKIAKGFVAKRRFNKEGEMMEKTPAFSYPDLRRKLSASYGAEVMQYDLLKVADDLFFVCPWDENNTSSGTDAVDDEVDDDEDVEDYDDSEDDDDENLEIDDEDEDDEDAVDLHDL